MTEIITIPESWKMQNILENSTLKARIGWQGLTTTEYKKTGKIYLVTGTDFKDGKIDWENCVYVDEKRYSQDKNIQIKIDDVLVTKDGTIGKIAYVDKLPLPTTLNSGIFVIRSIKNDYLHLFLFYILSSNYFIKFLNKLKAGSTIIHLYQKDFASFNFVVPPISEQQQIIQILSNTDKLIEKLEKIIEKKKNIKQGAIQEFLTGTKRLDGFNEKWIFTKLDEVAEMFSGGTPLTSNRSYYDGNIPWVIITDITKAKKYLYSTEKNITQQGLESCSAKIFQKGVLLFAMYASIGKCCIAKIDVTCNQAILGIVTKKIDTEFLYQHMVFSEKRFSQMGQTGTQNNLNKEMVQNLDIPYPHIDEQIAIGKILSDMDVEINELEKNRDKYVMIKNGMMQKLLTGEIRLK